MQITLDIPNPPKNQEIIEIPLHFCGGKVVEAGGYGFEERKNGKWFDSANKWDAMANKHNFFCQECKRFAMDFVSGTEDWWCHEAPSYCPNCGANMEGEDE